MTELWNDLGNRQLEVLTSEQRVEWQKLTEEPFKNGGTRQRRPQKSHRVAACRSTGAYNARKESLLPPMTDALRLLSLALFAVGPVVALMALLRRRLEPSPMRSRIRTWRGHVPAILLPAEWLLPPILIALRLGEIQVGWLPLRVVGLAVGLAGAVLLTWSAVLLGRFLMHEAAVREDHSLIGNGPYRFVRHPVYAGYLALLLGSGVASLNIFLWLLWPVSLLGILIQAGSEEQLLGERFGQDYECYVRRTGRLVPRLWGQAASPDAVPDHGG